MDGLPRPILQRRHRERALGAIFLGNGEALQRSWAVATPLTHAVDGSGFLLWRLPEFVSDPRRLCAGVLGYRLTARARAAHACTNRELRRLTLRQAPACTAWTIRRCRDRTRR